MLLTTPYSTSQLATVTLSLAGGASLLEQAFCTFVMVLSKYPTARYAIMVDLVQLLHTHDKHSFYDSSRFLRALLIRDSRSI
jgi:hypothetical protein